MTTNIHLATIVASTLTFLFLALQFPVGALGQAITFTEEPLDNYYIVKKKPVSISCGARHAVDISFTCGGVKVPPTSVELEAFVEDDPEVVRATIQVTRNDVNSYTKNEKYWCECNAIGIDGQVALTSKRGDVSTAILKYRFKKQPTSLRVTDGESVEFFCEPPVSDPKPEIFWKKDNKRLNIDADDRLVLAESGSLLIDSATDDDAGTYSCVARNPAGRRESKGADLVVAVLAEAGSDEAKSREIRSDSPVFSTEPKSVYYIKPDEELTIDCGATGASIITFRCNGVRMDRKRTDTKQGQDSEGTTIVQTQLRLLYSDVEEFHRRQGNKTNYQCQCVGWYQAGGKWETLLSQKSHGIVKRAYLEKTFRREPSDVMAGVNLRATLRCEPPKGVPSPWVYWYKDNVKIDPRADASYRVSRDGNLIVLSAKFEDTGRYKCVAENIVDKVESRVAILRISATPPPSTTPATTLAPTGITIPDVVGEGSVFLKDLPDKTTIGDDGVAKLACITLGATMLSIDCNGRRLPVSEFKLDREMNERTKKMMLTITTEVGAGDVRGSSDGYYCQCTAWDNKDGKWSQNYGNQGFIVEEQRSFIKKTFVYPPKDQEVSFEESVEIPCEPPEGNPMPTVYWLKDGDKVDPNADSNFVVLQAGTLVLEYARAEDAGMYVCVAENEAGTRRSEPAKLTVTGLPTATDCLEAIKTCQGIMTAVTDITDLDMVCKAVDETKECMKNVVCPPALQSTIEEGFAMIDQTSEQCNKEVMPEGANECMKGLVTCQEYMGNDMQSGDPTIVCRAAQEAMECFKGLTCPNEIQAPVDQAIAALGQSLAACEGGATEGPDTGSLDACATSINKCQQLLEQASQGRGDKCSFAMSIKTCYMNLQCPKQTQQSIMDQVLATLGQTLADCGGMTTPSGVDSSTMEWKTTTYDYYDSTFTGELEPFFSKEPEAFNYIIGNQPSVTLSCIVLAAKTLMFACNGQTLKNTANTGYVVNDKAYGHVIRGNNITITAEQVDAYQGAEPFHCICKGFSQREDNGEWYSVDSRKAVIQRSYFDYDFVKEPMATVGTKGNTATLECIPPEGVPKPKVSWIKDGFNVNEGGRFMVTESGSLVIKNLMVEDEGQYTCMADNDMEQRTSQSAMLSVSMQGNAETTPMPDKSSIGTPVGGTVSPSKGGAYFSKDLPSISYVTKKKGVTLQCEATRVSSVEFMCGGYSITSESEQSQKEIPLEDGGVDYVSVVMASIDVTLDDVESQNDEFYCQCRAVDMNGDFLDSQEGFVEVAFLKKRFVQEPENTRVSEGSFLSVTCIPPAGNPMPEVSWLKNGKPYNMVSLSPDGPLVIESASMEDSGEYTCVATNVYASRKSAPILVEVMAVDGTMTTPGDSMGGKGEVTMAPTTKAYDHSDGEAGGDMDSTTEDVVDSSDSWIVHSTRPVDHSEDWMGRTTEEMDHSEDWMIRVTDDGVDVDNTWTTETYPTPEPSAPNMDSTTEFDNIMVERVTMVDEMQICIDMPGKCDAIRPQGEALDAEKDCKGPDSYKGCMENLISGCTGLLDDNLMENLRQVYGMVKESCMQATGTTCPDMGKCRMVYYEGGPDEDMTNPGLPLHLFCRDIDHFMQCADETMANCGVTMTNPGGDEASRYEPISQWFEQYCQKFVLADSSLTSCDVMTQCDLPIEVVSKDDSTYWCNLVNTLHSCTNNSVSVCGLEDLKDDLEEMKQLKQGISCGMMDMMPEKEMDKTTQKESGMTEPEGSTQASKCKGDSCGAASIGVSILLVTLIQIALALFTADHR